MMKFGASERTNAARRTLEELAKADGLIGTIFRKSMNKLSDPAKLTRVVSLIDSEGPWIGIGVDVKGEIYEGLLERNASKSLTEN